MAKFQKSNVNKEKKKKWPSDHIHTVCVCLCVPVCPYVCIASLSRETVRVEPSGCEYVCVPVSVCACVWVVSGRRASHITARSDGRVT